MVEDVLYDSNFLNEAGHLAVTPKEQRILLDKQKWIFLVLKMMMK